MRVLFLTNIPSPYRVDFFNEFGKYCDLTVTFEGHHASDRSLGWESENYKTFTAIFLNGLRVRSDQFLCIKIISIIKQEFDHIIVGGYSTPTSILAIEYMKIHGIPFWIEADGGLIAKDGPLKYTFKKQLISSATNWLSSGNMTTDYLVHYGAKRDRIFLYPFTSIKEKDIVEKTLSLQEKDGLRKKIMTQK